MDYRWSLGSNRWHFPSGADGLRTPLLGGISSTTERPKRIFTILGANMWVWLVLACGGVTELSKPNPPPDWPVGNLLAPPEAPRPVPGKLVEPASPTAGTSPTDVQTGPSGAPPEGVIPAEQLADPTEPPADPKPTPPTAPVEPVAPPAP